MSDERSQAGDSAARPNEGYTGCRGMSAAGGEVGMCRVRPRWLIEREGKSDVYACGRHVAWALGVYVHLSDAVVSYIPDEHGV